MVRNWKRILDDLRGVVYGDTDFGRTFPFRAFAISIWNPHSIGFVLLGCRIPLDDRYAHTSLQSSASGRTILDSESRRLRPVSISSGGHSSLVVTHLSQRTGNTRQITRLCDANE